MAIFKCKMCGGDLDVAEGVRVCECDSCGTKQTVPTADDEKTLPRDNGLDPAAAALLRRAQMFLEEGEWFSADEYAERVLDIAPECVEAYLCKMMADLHLVYRSNLETHWDRMEKNRYFQKVMRFADDELKQELQGYITEGKREQRTSEYESLLSKIDKKHSSEEWRELAAEIRAFEDMADSADVAQTCEEKAEEQRRIEVYDKAMKTYKEAATVDERMSGMHYGWAADLFRTIPGYKNADELLKICWDKKQAGNRDKIYREAELEMKKANLHSLGKAIELFQSIADWKDAAEKIRICKEQIELVKQQIEAEDREMEKRIAEQQRQAEENRLREEYRATCRRQGRCQHCGGAFKGFLLQKCSFCGKIKDY